MTAYHDIVALWTDAIRDGHELPPRAEIYRELVAANISSLLQTNLPRTHEFMGVDAWTLAVAQFLGARTQRSPYFVDLAAEFVETLGSGPVGDLAHFEALCLEVETTRDTDTRRLAAYEHNVLADPVLEGLTFVSISRDPIDFTVLTRAITAADFVRLSDELG